MTDQATPAKVRLTDGLGPLPERDARWALAAEVARGRMAGGWVPVDADLVLALDARLAELAALADVADAGRVLAWAQETPRRPANAAFTAGPERQAAYWIEWSEAKERERWQRIATNAQAVTTGCQDRINYFKVPSHLMAALALALAEGPNAEFTGPRVGHRSNE